MLRIRIRIYRIHIFWASRIWILPSSCKKSTGKKNYLVTLFDFLTLKNDVYVSSKSNKQKNVFFFYWVFVGILKVSYENSRIQVRIRIRTKMSCIRHTVWHELKKSIPGSARCCCPTRWRRRCSRSSSSRRSPTTRMRSGTSRRNSKHSRWGRVQKKR